jgi:hypothetical protein
VPAQHEYDMRTKNREQSDHDVASWRRERLAQSGFPLPLAAHLAKDARYDLHALIELVERGCPPRLAVRICAPLEEGTAA